jgi:gluconokinase
MVIILMGVAGSGKTTVGRELAGELGWKFYDADDFHPRANVEKMSRGVPLGDADRAPWLERLRELIESCPGGGEDAVLACSALKENYRRTLVVDDGVKLVYLKGDRELLLGRLSERHGHFMKPEMLDSQLATLEEPQHALTVDINETPEEIAAKIRERFGV